MSAVLLINPLAPSGPMNGHVVGAMDNKDNVPVKPVTDSGTSGDPAPFLGSGDRRGISQQEANVAILRAGKRAGLDWPSGATGQSVVNAQAQTEDNPFGIYLPDVEMPYPLPTSPFLMRDD